MNINAKNKRIKGVWNKTSILKTSRLIIGKSKHQCKWIKWINSGKYISISTRTDTLMIEQKKQQLYKEANQWLLF